jgi:hypothetical protein
MHRVAGIRVLELWDYIAMDGMFWPLRRGRRILLTWIHRDSLRPRE